MTRTFHPVGQGAFYSEQFHVEDREDFRIVYDCGTKTSKQKVDPAKVVQEAFNDSKQIDILFISHFDKDHVSMIAELLRRHAIRLVVLPLLPIEEKSVLQAYYSDVGNDIGYELLVDPFRLFGKETSILYVEATGDETLDLLPDNAEVPRGIQRDANVIIIKPNGELVDVELGSSAHIPSGARILVPRYSWCYIPHNYEYPQRHQALVNELAKRTSIDQTRLGDASYINDKSIELNNVYKSLEAAKCGDINENSMLVYSGPWQVHLGITHGCRGFIWDGRKFHCMHTGRPACIYSGDTDFHKVKIHEVYKRVWKNIGTVQIPHHGSRTSFSAEFLDESNRFYLCPISTGRHYGHPSSRVLKDILIRHSLPLIIDEAPHSKFVEHLWQWR